MKCVTSIILYILFSQIILIGTAAARDWECPGATNNDQCDQMVFERADRELAKALEQKVVDLGTRTTDKAGAERAKWLILSAQRQWAAFRDAECEASAVMSFMSARTKAGLKAACLLEMTTKRIANVNAY